MKVNSIVRFLKTDYSSTEPSWEQLVSSSYNLSDTVKPPSARAHATTTIQELGLQLQQLLLLLLLLIIILNIFTFVQTKWNLFVRPVKNDHLKRCSHSV